MRIFLVGFMGCGKSSIGRHLARHLSLSLLDLDSRVEERGGITIREIFELHGEDAFRDLEHRCLCEIEQEDDLVIATGGGSFVFERNREIINQLGTSVWIRPDFENIVSRMSEQGKRKRPLFQNPEQAGALYRERIPAYRRADIEIHVSPEETARQVAARIAAQLQTARPQKNGVRDLQAGKK